MTKKTDERVEIFPAAVHNEPTTVTVGQCGRECPGLNIRLVKGRTHGREDMVEIQFLGKKRKLVKAFLDMPRSHALKLADLIRKVAGGDGG
jgi:hypothetical protein